ncbi:hypothetical protein BDM02DRAFT_3131799 [Thelephora ganbajun]|uniref:Uncharacterized protein n=1 Tax=Thelephora ganbajun TaxID=370292 RepID=A0ACB6Z3Y2_THEGA|nr:hypothetical protein BDM02DRAFT_3131799 [Thelephora ganbajun]
MSAASLGKPSPQTLPIPHVPPWSVGSLATSLSKECMFSVLYLPYLNRPVLEWLRSTLFSPLALLLPMDGYKLYCTINAPVSSIHFMEFSTNGRFLAVGGEGSNVLYILDKLAGFRPTLSANLFANPASLVWESATKFYVGLSDGRFVDYRIDLANKRLAKGTTNSSLRGGLPATAIAIDAESKTLALAVGPDVFALRRVNRTGEFHLVANISSRFNFERSPGSPAPPFPRSLSFVPNTDLLVIAFCRQNLAWVMHLRLPDFGLNFIFRTIALVFDEGLNLHASFQMGKIDYSGLPLLKAIALENGQSIHGFSRFWIYGKSYQADGDGFPFLFIDGGARMLSGSATGSAVIRDTVTQRQIQLLEHDGKWRTRISKIAYHVSERQYSIATATSGVDAVVKVWTAPNPTHSVWHYVAYVVLVAIAMAIVVFNIVKFPEEEQLIRFIAQIVSTIIKGCDRVRGLVTSVAEHVSYAVEVVQRRLEDIESALNEMSKELTADAYF